jgi:hypothetical protein
LYDDGVYRRILLRNSFHLFVRYSIVQVASTELPNVGRWGVLFHQFRVASALNRLDCWLLGPRILVPNRNMCLYSFCFVDGRFGLANSIIQFNCCGDVTRDVQSVFCGSWRLTLEWRWCN